MVTSTQSVRTSRMGLSAPRTEAMNWGLTPRTTNLHSRAISSLVLATMPCSAAKAAARSGCPALTQISLGSCAFDAAMAMAPPMLPMPIKPNVAIWITSKRFCYHSSFWREMQLRISFHPKPFPRGEGGPEGVGRGMRAITCNMVQCIRPTTRLNIGKRLYVFSIVVFPPAFLFSQESAPKSRFLTASPRGKRFGAYVTAPSGS